MATTDKLNSILNEIKLGVPEITGAMITTTDGMLITSLINSSDLTRMAAMVATALGLGRRISDSFKNGSFEETTITGGAGSVSIFAAGSKSVLAIIYPKGTNIGLLLLEARNAAQSIAQILV